MKRVKIELFFIAATAVLTMFIYSCTDSSSPIFYTLENEKQVVDTSLDNSLSVHSFVTDGTNYYAAAGSIFYRSVQAGSQTWNKVTSSGVSDASGTTMLCNKLVEFNGKYYAAFISQDGNTHGLYSTDSLGSSITWTKATYEEISDKQITNIIVVNGNLLAVRLESTNPGTYYLYYSSDGASFTEATALSEGPVPIIDAAYDNASSEYWVMTENKLFKGSDLSGLTETASPTAPPEGFGGIIYSADFSKLFVSTQNGIIYGSDDNGAAWSQVGDTAKVSDKSVPFGGFAKIDNSTIFVATKGYGFYIITGGTVISRFTNSTISGLYNAVINSFYVDSSANLGTVFICTSGSGLWSNATPNDDTAWKWE
ncbi:MAG: hypothetical protein DRP57_00930 [Spirochaetes bacterium]|nr:MAG: hypothetical protein DRP57_00930 [Spirochaetota bacterium]